MPNVQRYFPQVGLPNPVTGVPQTGATPIADTIGKIAGVGQDLAQAYSEAQYASDATEVELEIKRKINAYHENLRVNPIEKKVGEDIVKTKEADWNKFAQDLQNNYIGKIPDQRLNEETSRWWLSASEDGRANVVESAMDENIEYMGKAQLERINEFIEAGEWVSASTATIAGGNTGLFGRDEEDGIQDYITRRKFTAEALEMDYADGVIHIKQQDMPATEKAKALDVLKATEEERIRQAKEAFEQRQDEDLESGFLGISTEEILTMPQLDERLEDGGVYESLDGAMGQRLRTALQVKINRREAGIDDKDDDIVEDYMKLAFLSNDRATVLGVMHDLETSLGMSPTLKKKYYGIMDSNAYPQLNERVMKYSEDQFDAMAKTGSFGKEPIDIADAKARIFGRIYDFQTSEGLTPRDIAMEKGFTEEDAKKLFWNERQKVIGFDLDNVDTLREFRGNDIITDPERLLQFGLGGGLYGSTNGDALELFVSDETMDVNQLRETASREYGKPYKNLNSDQENQVDLTVAAGQLLRLTGEQWKLDFKDLGVDGQLAIEQETGLPIIQSYYIDHNGNPQDKLYKMSYSERGKEEFWLQWTERVGWEVSPLTSIPDLENRTSIERAIDKIKDNYEALRDVDPGPITESERIRLEQETLRLKEMEEAQEGTVLGNALKGLWGKIFSGND